MLGGDGIEYNLPEAKFAKLEYVNPAVYRRFSFGYDRARPAAARGSGLGPCGLGGAPGSRGTLEGPGSGMHTKYPYLSSTGRPRPSDPNQPGRAIAAEIVVFHG